MHARAVVTWRAHEQEWWSPGRVHGGGARLVMWVGEKCRRWDGADVLLASSHRGRRLVARPGPQTCCIDSVAGIEFYAATPQATFYLNNFPNLAEGGQHSLTTPRRARRQQLRARSLHACLRSAAQMKLSVRAHHRSGGLPAARHFIARVDLINAPEKRRATRRGLSRDPSTRILKVLQRRSTLNVAATSPRRSTTCLAARWRS